jgi:hypothetical protein
VVRWRGLLGVEALGLRGAGKVQVRGKVRGSNIRPVKNAYELAKAGKIHGRTYEKNLHKPAQELNKSIRSLQKRIAEHRAKVANPQNYDPKWNTYPAKRQNDALTHWRKELKTFTEQRDIYAGILKNRKE